MRPRNCRRHPTGTRSARRRPIAPSGPIRTSKHAARTLGFSRSRPTTARAVRPAHAARHQGDEHVRPARSGDAHTDDMTGTPPTTKRNGTALGRRNTRQRTPHPPEGSPAGSYPSAIAVGLRTGELRRRSRGRPGAGELLAKIPRHLSERFRPAGPTPHSRRTRFGTPTPTTSAELAPVRSISDPGSPGITAQLNAAVDEDDEHSTLHAPGDNSRPHLPTLEHRSGHSRTDGSELRRNIPRGRERSRFTWTLRPPAGWLSSVNTRDPQWGQNYTPVIPSPARDGHERCPHDLSTLWTELHACKSDHDGPRHVATARSRSSAAVRSGTPLTDPNEPRRGDPCTQRHGDAARTPHVRAEAIDSDPDTDPLGDRIHTPDPQCGSVTVL
jgi:hypothetical protein